MPVEMEYRKVPNAEVVRDQARTLFFERTGFDVQDYLDAVKTVQPTHDGNTVVQTHREVVMGNLTRARYTFGYDI